MRRARSGIFEKTSFPSRPRRRACARVEQLLRQPAAAAAGLASPPTLDAKRQAACNDRRLEQRAASRRRPSPGARAQPGRQMRIRVATLNVWALPGPLAPSVGARMRAIGRRLASLDLDAIAFQEVWTEGARDLSDRRRSGGGSAQRLASPGGLRRRTARAHAPADPVGALRRVLRCAAIRPGRITRTTTAARAGRRSSSRPARAPCCSSTPICMPATRATSRTPTARIASARSRSWRWPSRQLQHPVVMLGDLNFADEHPEHAILTGLAGLRDVAAELGSPSATVLRANPYRAHSSKPDRRVDYVFVRDGGGTAVRAAPEPARVRRADSSSTAVRRAARTTPACSPSWSWCRGPGSPSRLPPRSAVSLARQLPARGPPAGRSAPPRRSRLGGSRPGRGRARIARRARPARLAPPPAAHGAAGRRAARADPGRGALDRVRGADARRATGLRSARRTARGSPRGSPPHPVGLNLPGSSQSRPFDLRHLVRPAKCFKSFGESGIDLWVNSAPNPRDHRSPMPADAAPSRAERRHAYCRPRAGCSWNGPFFGRIRRGFPLRSVAGWAVRRLLAVLGDPPLRFALWNGESVSTGASPPVATVRLKQAARPARPALEPPAPLRQFLHGWRPRDRGRPRPGPRDPLRRSRPQQSALGVARALAKESHPPLAAPRAPRHPEPLRSRQRLLRALARPPDVLHLRLFPVAGGERSRRRSSPSSTTSAASCGCGPESAWWKPAAAGARSRSTWRAHYGVRVTAFNISREQIALRARARRARRAWRAASSSSRTTTATSAGRYDAFVSVGMLEHVGRRALPRARAT